MWSPRRATASACAVRDMSEKRDVREAAVKYLSYKARTRAQVVEHLRRKGFEDGEIEEAVKELEAYRYIDDMAYSSMYFRYGFDKGRGIMRIKRELAEKGVDRDVIEAAFDELEDVPDQFEEALRIAGEALGGADMSAMAYEEKRKLKGRVSRRLAGRGFSSDVIYRVLDRLD